MLRTILLEPLLNLLLLFYALIPGGDFGLAVIALTILVRILMWPLVKKQMHHSKTMRELQPEINKIKKKAKGDKQKESQMMVELFKEKEINPFGSIGLALVQFPVLIALFFVLREVVTGDVAASTYGFIQDMPAVQGILSNPDAFDPTLFGYFHMAEPSIILALVAGGFQYFQAKQIAPQQSSGDDAASKMSGNMVKIFPAITVVIGSTLPSALVLYWGTSSIVAVLQQHVILQSEVSLMQRLKPRSKNNTAESEPKAKPEKKKSSSQQNDKTNNQTKTKQSAGKKPTKTSAQAVQSKPKTKKG